MAAQLRIDSDSAGGVHDYGGNALVFSVLHDLLGAAAFLASHPLHAAYVLFFSRYLLWLASFFCPLLVSTSLLLAVLVTAGPYVTTGWPGVSSLGRTCGIAVAALCAELRPDGGGVSLVGQLCSFVLGPADVAAVLRVGEIMGELCDISAGSCFLLEEKTFFLSGTQDEEGIRVTLQSPIGEEIFLEHGDFYEDVFKDKIEDKNVVSEHLKGPVSSPSSSEHCCQSETLFVQEIKEQEKSIEVQSISLSVIDGGVGGGVEEKRLECDPVPVETKKCEWPKSHSSISRRIRQWEDVTSGNLKRVPDDTLEKIPVDNSLEKASFKDVKVIIQLETESCNKEGGVNQLAQEIVSVGESDQTEKESCNKKFSDLAQDIVSVGESDQPEKESCNKTFSDLAQEIASVGESYREQPEQEFVDVKELLQSKTEKCSKELEPEENAPIEQTQEEMQEQNVQPEPELQEQSHMDTQNEQDFQDVEPLKELGDQEHKDADEESETLQDDAREENPLKSTSIARRVHTRISSESLVGEASPGKEKEWKRTLACKLYEERIQLKLLRDRAVVGACSDDMDMLWEAYETGGGSSATAGDTKRGGSKAKRGNAQDELVDEGELEEDEDVDDEGTVRQLCCLQALKFSTRKMNFGGGKPSLAKISKVLKRMTALSRVGSRRNVKG
ncbi:uncharacterized protein LOC124695689 [Lolium rigidum]|uniref:uncharacterized protein LOC124695689 n=1 Tax=Lolium rigidum TaxID=89674 RepID=UPI001F5D6FE6|nr:uncharacterized protein LOC124695689 [Lolium rigidum]